MNTAKKLVFLFIILVLLSSCNTVAPRELSSVSNNIILLFPDEAAQVELKRDGWEQYVKVSFGTIISITDLIKSDGAGVVLCPDLSIRPIPTRGRAPCDVNKGWLKYNNYEFGSQRGYIAQEIPYIIYPRSSSILTFEPSLYWHDTGASSYTVSIRKDGKSIWENKSISGNYFQYPLSGPDLITAEDYLLIVTDNDTGRSSNEDPAKGLGFEVPEQGVLKLVEQRQSEIMSLEDLSIPARKLTLAIYYANVDISPNRRLLGESWVLLDEIKESLNEPIVYYQLGNVYSSLSLNENAITAYENAYILAKQREEKEIQALSSSHLWRLTGSKIYLDESVYIYEQIGDQEKVQILKNGGYLK
ncbi:hypothetical protein FBQ99_08615 [Chloroflexi bacterium CFX2]|nr:hypothetical protein [Chloroflexi bacterium CFX2]